MPTVMMSTRGSSLGGTIEGLYGTYVADANGNITVDSRDTQSLLNAGCAFLRQASTWLSYPYAPAAALATAYFNSALANGSVTFAAQPEVPRQVVIAIGAGVSAITAGTLTVTYNANDGTVQTDTFSAITGASGTTTVYLSKGCSKLVSAAVADLVGGTSPTLQIGSTTALALLVDPNASAINLRKEVEAGADVAVGSLVTTSFACVTPHAVPNATLVYDFHYSYLAPVV